MSDTGEQTSPNWRDKWFPDRQVYMRTQGEVRFIPLSSAFQIFLSALFIVFVAWVIYSSTRVLLRDTIIEAKDGQINELNSQNAEQEQSIERLQGTLMDQALELEERSDYLLGLVEADPSGELSSGLVENPPAENKDTDADQDKTSALVLPASGADHRGLMQVFFSQASAAPGPLPENDFEHLLEARLSRIATRQDRAAATLARFAERKLAEFDDILAPYKIKAEDLARAATLDLSGPAQGGPYMPEPASGEQLTASIMDQKTAPYPDLNDQWAELIKVYSGMQSVPLLYPVVDFYQSSRFGRRTDPITEKSAWHSGVDLAGWPGTEIFAPTSGVVTKAGQWGNYGNMVEVDHGNGFKTRYAHLRKIKVKRGQRVVMGEVLGEMGCSGRCVSTHLHYEVFFNNNLRNPQPFMEPQDDVQQTQREAASTYRKGK